MDHITIPPPPYSETDPGTVAHTPSTSQADDASLPPDVSAASSADSVVFTPPYTPTESGHHFLHSDQSVSAAAVAYFDSRPTFGRPVPIPKVYTITITSVSKPQDFPYPSDSPLNDVSDQDWATFINYLFPDHSASTNSDVADRKLEAELESLKLGSESRSPMEMSHVEAQLKPLRQNVQATQQLGERLEKIDATITEWNTGFFEPRGVQIRFIEPELRLEEETSTTREIPGSWVPYDQEVFKENKNSEISESRGFNFPGINFAGIEASTRGLRLWNLLRADNQGLRLGGDLLVADSNGLRLGGPRGIIADSSGVTVAGRNFGRRDERDRSFEHGRGGKRSHHGRHDRHDRGNRGRGISRDHGRHRHGRSSSASTSSSSSSSSSSDSDASVGSLPDYDDLEDQHLPQIKETLLRWLNHPNQPITRESVRSIKEEVKAAKKSNPVQLNQDLKALRSDVKNLMKEFKELTRAQKISRKQARKEKRTARKVAKKERRATRKEERRQRKGKYKEEPSGSAGLPAALGMGHMVAKSTSLPMPMVPGARGPFGRGGGGLGARGPSLGRSTTGPAAISGLPGMAALHGAWPFARRLSSPGYPVSEHMGGPVSQSASSIYQQARDLDNKAAIKEANALSLRAACTGKIIGEKEKLKRLDQAVQLEEEAEIYRRESDRLMAEAVHLDGELARDLN